MLLLRVPDPLPQRQTVRAAPNPVLLAERGISLYYDDQAEAMTSSLSQPNLPMYPSDAPKIN